MKRQRHSSSFTSFGYGHVKRSFATALCVASRRMFTAPAQDHGTHPRRRPTPGASTPAPTIARPIATVLRRSASAASTAPIGPGRIATAPARARLARITGNNAPTTPSPPRSTPQRAVRGTVSIRYTNNSPDTLRFVWLQLDQNLYQPGSKGARCSPPTRAGAFAAFAVDTTSPACRSTAAASSARSTTP